MKPLCSNPVQWEKFWPQPKLGKERQKTKVGFKKNIIIEKWGNA
jgi:hypothetical protein